MISSGMRLPRKSGVSNWAVSPAATVSVIGRRSPRVGMIVYEPGSSGVSPPTECTLTEPSPHTLHRQLELLGEVEARYDPGGQRTGLQ